MKKRKKFLILIAAVLTLAAGGGFLLAGSKRNESSKVIPRKPVLTQAANVSEQSAGVLPPTAEVMSMLSDGGGVSGPAYSPPPGWSQQQLALVEAALASQDVEGALIALLSNPNAPHNLVVWYLGEIGTQRAYAALQGQVGTQLGGESYVETNLLLISLRVNGLTPLQQVERISQELAAIQASPGRGDDKWGPGGRLIQRLGTLGLPEGLDALDRLIAEDLKLWKEGSPPIGNPKHWLPYKAVVQAFDQIGDPRAVSLVEAIFPSFMGGRGDDSWASRVSWTLKLKATPQEKWPDLLRDCLVSLSPSASTNRVEGARMIGPACLPKVKRVLADRGVSWLGRVDAVHILVALRDPEAPDILLRLASDPSEDPEVRAGSCYGVGVPGTPEGLQRTLELARRAAAERQVNVLDAALAAAEGFARRGLKPTPDDEAFLRDLAANYPKRVRYNAATWLLAEFGLGPRPEPLDLPGAPG